LHKIRYPGSTPLPFGRAKPNHFSSVVSKSSCPLNGRLTGHISGLASQSFTDVHLRPVPVVPSLSNCGISTVPPKVKTFVISLTPFAPIVPSNKPLHKIAAVFNKFSNNTSPSAMADWFAVIFAPLTNHCPVVNSNAKADVALRALIAHTITHASPVSCVFFMVLYLPFPRLRPGWASREA